MNKPTLLILAAGLGSRYGGLKQIDSVGPSGERIIDYSVYDAKKAGFGKIVYIIRKSFEEEFKETILSALPSSIETELVFQEPAVFNKDSSILKKRNKPWGTGHAIISAANKIQDKFLVVNADDFYGFESYQRAINFFSASKDNNENALIGYRLKNTLSQFGSVSRGICQVDDQNYIKSIVERKKIEINGENIIAKSDNNTSILYTGNEIASMNMFLFNKSIISLFQKHFELFLNNYLNDSNSEYYIPTAANSMIENNETKIKIVETSAEWFGLTYSADKDLAQQRIMKLIEQGEYPKNLWENYKVD